MQDFATNAYIAIVNRTRQVLDSDRERGLTTTEIAVLTFVLVAIAVAIGGLLYTYADGRVDALPPDTNPQLVPATN